jgi:SAM-dependent methyltransferase
VIQWRRPAPGPLPPPPPPEAVRPGQGEFEAVAPYYDALMAGVPYSRWVDYVERLLAVYETPVGRALDLACGTGQVGAELLRRGYHAVGADLSEPMARACAGQNPPLRAAVMDAAHLGLRPASLDLVVCLFDSLNYLLEPESLRRCFADVQEALAPGKLLIFDLNTPRALKVGLFTQNNLASSALLQYRWEAHWEAARKLCRVDMWFRWRGEGEPREFVETHYQRAYEEAEVARWLREAGFARVDSYEAYSLRPVGTMTDRMFFVAQKGA